MQVITASPEGEIQDRAQALIASAAQVDHAHHISPHQHHRGQFLFSLTGNLQVQAADQTWHLSPENAVWLPSGVPHGIEASNGVAYRSVYVDELHAKAFPARAGVTDLNRQIKALVNESAQFGQSYRSNTPESRLLNRLSQHMQNMIFSNTPVLVPQHPRLKLLCQQILAKPALHWSLADWGAKYGASERHLARLFKAETGMTYLHWCHRVRVYYALTQLRRGASVSAIAHELAYESVSAFCYMFKKVLGDSPTAYLKSH